MKRNSSSSKLRFNPNKYSSNRKSSKREPTNRAKNKRLRSAFRLIILFFAGLVVIFIIATNLRITSVNVSSNAQAYVQTINEYLNRNVIADFKLAISGDNLASNLYSNHPEIASVEVRLPIVGNELTVDIVQRSSQLVITDESSFNLVVDESGVAYDTAESIMGQRITVLDKTGISYSVGNQVLPSAEVEFIRTVYDFIRSEDLYGSDLLVIFELTDQARLLRADLASEGYFIKLQLDKSVEKQLTDLLEVVKYLVEKGITPNNYIDIRVADKAFYR